VRDCPRVDPRHLRQIGSTALLGGGLIGVALAILAVSLTMPLRAWLALKRRWTERIRVTSRGLRTTLVTAVTFSASGWPRLRRSPGFQ